MSAQPAQAYPQTPPEPSLPIGVAILSVLIGIVGLFFIVAGVLLAILGIGVGLSFPALTHYGGVVLGIILLIIGLIILGLALGLWHQRLWALVIAILIFGAYFVSDVLAGAFFSIGAILSLILVIYLIAVHRHFL
jgi:hypothetical protein